MFTLSVTISSLLLLTLGSQLAESCPCHTRRATVMSVNPTNASVAIIDVISGIEATNRLVVSANVTTVILYYIRCNFNTNYFANNSGVHFKLCVYIISLLGKYHCPEDTTNSLRCGQSDSSSTRSNVQLSNTATICHHDHNSSKQRTKQHRAGAVQIATACHTKGLL